MSSAPPDIAVALAAFQDAAVIDADVDGVARHVRGSLGRVAAPLSADPANADEQVRGALGPALAAFRLRPAALQLRKMNHGADGRRHLRYTQKHQGSDVIGGDLIVSVDHKGTIYSIKGTARGDFPTNAGQAAIGKQAAGDAVAQDARFHGLQQRVGRQVFIHADGVLAKAYEVEVTGTRDALPVRDLVYVDVDSGVILEVHPQIHHVKNRATHLHDGSLPGALARIEGQPATGNVDVDTAHDLTGLTYDAYKLFWNRDSVDGAGAQLVSTVSYGTTYCNAYWSSADHQMVYGDGDGVTCKSLARSIDVVGHEIAHGVTQFDSNLTYSGESGGINESMSDIFGAFAEAYKDGGSTGTLVVDGSTFLLGELVKAPFIRDLCNPSLDGTSADYWYPGVGNLEVHSGSGPANLMFCLLVKGGSHPKGKSSVLVPAIGMDKAIRLAYYANANELTASSGYAAYRTAMLDAAEALYGLASPERAAVDKAFAAVGVDATTPVPDVGPTVQYLSTYSPTTDLSDAKGGEKLYRVDVAPGMSSFTVEIVGGTGDADLYVKRGALPTATSYDCRPFLSSSTEKCVFYAPTAGTYYIRLHAYTAYSGVTLEATTHFSDNALILANNVAITNLSGAAHSQQYAKITVPYGKTLTIQMSGGAGDADLYAMAMTKPTLASYDCRPYQNGNNETCTFTNTSGTTYYVMLHGYYAYSGVSLKASY